MQQGERGELTILLLMESFISDAILGPTGFLRGSHKFVFGYHVGKKRKREKGGPGAVPEQTYIFNDFGCGFTLKMGSFGEAKSLKKIWF